MRAFTSASHFCLPVLLLALAGCSTGVTVNTIGTTPIGNIGGRVMGGHQPINGAEIFMFENGTGGTGGASKSLLDNGGSNTHKVNGGSTPFKNFYYVLTDATGSFSLGGDYTCDSGDQVYLVSYSGDPGGGTNTAAELMAVLGNCPSGGNLATQVPFVELNEVSTVAAAYALAGYAVDPTDISTTGTTLAATGIANAAASAALLYDISGVVNSGLGRTATPNGNGTVPQKTINALANSIATCIDSTGPTSPACTSLLGHAGSTGGTTGTIPTDTATAAINIAHYPAAAASTIYNVAPLAGQPFLPTLSSAPTDLTITISYSGGGLTSNSSSLPQGHGMDIDASGNVWIAEYAGTVLSKFSPLGVATSYSLALNNPMALAIDSASANVWISSYTGATGHVTKYPIGGTYVNYTTGIVSPTSIAVDGAGQVWVGNSNNNSLVALNASTGAVNTTTTGNGVSEPYSIAIEPGATGNVWVGNNFVNDFSVFTHAGATYATSTTYGSLGYSTGNAIDASNNVWFATNNGTGALSKIVAAATSGTAIETGTPTYGVAIDGNGDAWATTRAGGKILHYASAASPAMVALTPSTGGAPEAIAIDGAGNVWFEDRNSAALLEMIGAATPVVTPIAYGTTNTKLGTRP